MKYSIPKNCDNISDIDGVLYFAQRLEEMLFNYEQYKRLMAYMKALQKLEQMESIVEE